MPSNKRTLRSFAELLDRAEYTPEDTVFVLDTSFLLPYSNFHIWTLNNVALIDSISKKNPEHATLVLPQSMQDQYNRLLTERAVDEFGILLAQHPLEELLVDMNYFSIPTYTRNIRDISAYVWEQGPEGRRRRSEKHRLRGGDTEDGKRNPSLGPGRVDIDIISYSIEIARQGADVYVVSSDFRDVINPVRENQGLFNEAGIRLTALPPAELNSQYLRNFPQQVEATVTGEVISQLQDIKSTESYYPVVIFEKGVVSGDVTLDVGIGTAVKEYFREAIFPEQFNCIRDRVELVPVVKVKSGREEDLRPLYNAVRQFRRSRRLVLVNQEYPYRLKLINPGNLSIGKDYDKLIWRSDLNFLYYDSNSVFAQNNYRQQSRKR